MYLTLQFRELVAIMTIIWNTVSKFQVLECRYHLIGVRFNSVMIRRNTRLININPRVRLFFRFNNKRLNVTKWLATNRSLGDPGPFVRWFSRDYGIVRYAQELNVVLLFKEVELLLPFSSSFKFSVILLSGVTRGVRIHNSEVFFCHSMRISKLFTQC